MLRFAFLVLAGVVSGRPGRILIIISGFLLAVRKFVIRKSAQNRMNRWKTLRAGRRRGKGNCCGSARLVAVFFHIFFFNFTQDIQGFLRALAFLYRLEINLRKFRFLIQRSHSDGIDRIVEFPFFTGKNRSFFRFITMNCASVLFAFFTKSNFQIFSNVGKGECIILPSVRIVNTAAGWSRMFYGMVDVRPAVLIIRPGNRTFFTPFLQEIFNSVRYPSRLRITPINTENLSASKRYA